VNVDHRISKIQHSASSWTSIIEYWLSNIEPTHQHNINLPGHTDAGTVHRLTPMRP